MVGSGTASAAALALVVWLWILATGCTKVDQCLWEMIERKASRKGEERSERRRGFATLSKYFASAFARVHLSLGMSVIFPPLIAG